MLIEKVSEQQFLLFIHFVLKPGIREHSIFNFVRNIAVGRSIVLVECPLEKHFQSTATRKKRFPRKSQTHHFLLSIQLVCISSTKVFSFSQEKSNHVVIYSEKREKESNA